MARGQHTGWKKIGPKERMRVEYGLHQIGPQEPYITVTAEIEEKRGSRWVESSGGMLHEEVHQHFPELAELTSWHLTSAGAPMHYLANGQYWWEHILGTSKWDNEYADPVDAFKSTIIYGALPTDEEELELPEPPGRGKKPDERPLLYGEPAPNDIRPWLTSRLERIQEGFQEVVDKYDLKVFKDNPGRAANPDPTLRELKGKLLR